MLAHLRRHKGKLSIVLGVLLLPFVFHAVLARVARLHPPAVQLPADPTVQSSSGVRHFLRSYAVRQGKLWQVGLSGNSTQIGYSHARLLYPEMVKNEGILLGRFQGYVPNPVFRSLLLDLAQLRYMRVDQGMDAARLQEIEAGARAFSPDPYEGVFPTFQRMVYLNALYDMALSFEESPLIGCTSFVVREDADGGPLLARAFDFEVDSIFDQEKAVFLVREDGKIPFASVAWPGLVGVVSGMNAEGLAVVVHGARAGEVRAQGEPVVHALRRVLSTARNLDEAIAALKDSAPMVSHILIVLDAAGNSAVIERIPGQAPFVRRLEARAAVTNHLLGPGETDPKNQRVRQRTTTLARYGRAAQLIARESSPITVEKVAALLRDRKALDDKPLPLGDRRAIDALIATHGVIMNTRDRVLWVSESPHLLGRFVAFPLTELFGPGYTPHPDELRAAIPADPFAESAEYRAYAAKAP